MKRTLHIHDNWDIQGAMTIRCLAIVSATTAPWYWHFQIKHVTFHNGISGSFAEPPEVRFWSRFRVTLNDFWYRIHYHIDYLLRYCDILWGNLNKKSILVIYINTKNIKGYAANLKINSYLRFIFLSLNFKMFLRVYTWKTILLKFLYIFYNKYVKN